MKSETLYSISKIRFLLSVSENNLSPHSVGENVLVGIDVGLSDGRSVADGPIEDRCVGLKDGTTDGMLLLLYVGYVVGFVEGVV